MQLWQLVEQCVQAAIGWGLVLSVDVAELKDKCAPVSTNLGL